MIVAITGGPGIGKSFLVKKLAKHYNASLFLEGKESDFPKRILEDLRDNKRILELVLYFRTMRVMDFLAALRLKGKGKIVFFLFSYFSCKA